MLAANNRISAVREGMSRSALGVGGRGIVRVHGDRTFQRINSLTFPASTVIFKRNFFAREASWSNNLPRPTRPTVAEIDLSAIGFNLKGVRKKVGPSTLLMAVVKGNAYGHGLVDVARFAEKYSDYLGLAIPEEGKALREAGVQRPIHIFTLPLKSQAGLYTAFELEATVCSLNDARWLQREAERSKRTIDVHLKVETGMNRIGARVDELPSLIRSLRTLRRLRVKGLFSHFATAEERDKNFARHQIEQFHRAMEIAQKERLSPDVYHMANSGAILDLPESYFSMVRAGIMMYGFYPSGQTTESIPVRQAMTVRTKVSFVKSIDAGETVGYGRKFVASRRTTIATLPVGYADGYTRMLSGKAAVIIRGKLFPVVGTIAMDQMMVNVGKEDVQVGDDVVLMGREGGASISAWDLARRLGTVPYEICCAVSARVPRVYRST
jgi:alanine racemase